MNTKEQVMIIDVMRYADKNSGEIKSRIGFVLIDEKHKKSSDKFLGYAELSCFYDGDLVFKIPKNLILLPVTGVFEIKPNQANPLRTTSVLTAIEYKGNVYHFL